MIAPVTQTEFVRLQADVENNKNDIGYLKERTDRHSDKIDSLEDSHIALPLAIQEAVSKGMEPVLEKVLLHDERFTQLELLKEREEKERALRVIEDEKDRKKWFYRAVIGAVIGATVGPAITILAYILINSA